MIRGAEPRDTISTPAHRPEIWWVRREQMNRQGVIREVWFPAVAKTWIEAREMFELRWPFWSALFFFSLVLTARPDPQRASTIRAR